MPNNQNQNRSSSKCKTPLNQKTGNPGDLVHPSFKDSKALQSARASISQKTLLTNRSSTTGSVQGKNKVTSDLFTRAIGVAREISNEPDFTKMIQGLQNLSYTAVVPRL